MVSRLVLGLLVACGRSGFEEAFDGGARGTGKVDAVTDDAMLVSPDAPAPTRVGVYDFDEGTGTTVFDRSTELPALDLALGANTTWVAGGIQIGTGATATKSMLSAERIVTRCKVTNASSIEVWVQATDVTTTGTARIAAIAGNNNVSVLSIGQDAATFYGQTRTSMSSTKLNSAANTTTTQPTHLVHTHGSDGTRTLYIDGVAASTSVSVGDYSTWDTTLPLTFGDALNGGVLWRGTLFHAEIHCVAWSATEVQARFTAGL